jgi:ketosteroid isomerase-like protein
MSSNLSPAEVVRLMTDAYNRGDFDSGMALIHPQAVDHSAPGSPSSDVAAWRARWEAARADITDLTVEVEQVLVDGDMVARRLRTRGHRDGKPVEMTGLDMVRIQDGRLIEHWAAARSVP